MPTSNAGFSPRELQRRDFQATAAATLDRQAGVIGQVVDAINQTNERARMSGEFMADLSVRLDAIERRIACLEPVHAALDEVKARGLVGRLRWLLTGK